MEPQEQPKGVDKRYVKILRQIPSGYPEYGKAKVGRCMHLNMERAVIMERNGVAEFCDEADAKPLLDWPKQNKKAKSKDEPQKLGPPLKEPPAAVNAG